MDRGKRASMREGPLSALFRDTAAMDEEAVTPEPKARKAKTPKAEAPVAQPAAPTEPERITLPEPEAAPRIRRSTPAAEPAAGRRAPPP